ncbi:hypothetical protein MVES_001392 [Malassezia vespertilionis]|uniref:Uncharacterized protein n=1 Tax=Malassezia vespertilionis TaxID=2020962 RepID=A0A2N1JEI6_9BASI|nr:hypothetical protein MVES_001392 [Malassezia vespertilionis]
MSLPTTYADMRGRYRDPWKNIHARLSARSRVTNLGVTILVFFLAVSLLMNIRRSGRIVQLVDSAGSDMIKCTSSVENLRKSFPIVYGEKDALLTHLVVVAGHAIWKGGDLDGVHNDENWFLERYQRGGSVNTFVEHIKKGLEVAVNDTTSLLVFSGGQTRNQAWTTEAESYYRLALQLPTTLPTWPISSGRITSKAAFAPLSADAPSTMASTSPSVIQPVDTLPDLANIRMTTEDFALDSFQNLLFSIARFREYTGTYPEKITVVGYKFKEQRFKDLHAKAMRWDANKLAKDGEKRFHYIGIDDERQLHAQEKDNAYSLFAKDLYGCHGKLLDKRRKRNTSRRIPPYINSAYEIAGLVDWCPADNAGLQGLYPYSLPWDPRVQGSAIGRGARLALEQNGGKFAQEEILADGKKIVT